MTNKEINEHIELARQSGYNEACFIKDKKFKEFIRLKIEKMLNKMNENQNEK